VAAAAVLVAGAVALWALPLSRTAANGSGTVACGAPFFAVNRADPTEALDGLQRLEPGDAPATAPSRRALLRLTHLQAGADWYHACHHPAAMRLVAGSGLVAVSAVLLLAWTWWWRRGAASAAPTSRWDRSTHRRGAAQGSPARAEVGVPHLQL
jgi:hypothetical protein